MQFKDTLTAALNIYPSESETNEHEKKNWENGRKWMWRSVVDCFSCFVMSYDDENVCFTYYEHYAAERF